MDINETSHKFSFYKMKILVPIFFCLSILGQTFAHDTATEMAIAAKNFLDSLDD